MLTRVIAAYCIIEDIWKLIGHKEDKQTKAEAPQVLSIWVIACMEYGGNYRKALEYAHDMKLFSYVPLESCFNKRLHRLSDYLPLLLPAFRTLWPNLEHAKHYALDTFPMPVCENIRANRSKLAPEKTYRGYTASKRQYFHGLKLHLVTTDSQFIVEAELTVGSVADVWGLYGLTLDLPEGSELYVDRGYTDYLAEDNLLGAEAIELKAVRRSNSKRYEQAEQFLAILGRRIVETVGSSLTMLFPKRIHAVTLQGFIIKLMGFIMAHNVRQFLKL
jgi:hypothetical protein